MIKLSSSFKLNEIHRIDSPFNENPKNIIFFTREALISWEGRLENLGKMGNNRDIYCYANWEWRISKEHISPTPGTKILVMPHFSYMPYKFLGKNEKSQNFTLFQGPSFPKCKDVFKKVLYGQTSLVID